jgi:HK97 family phage major capsid protein
MQAATSFGTSATATTITYANLVEVEATMPVPYKNQDTAWIMSPEAVKVIRLLTDDNSSPLWEPSLKAGNPDFLLGYPVWVDGHIDAATSGKRAVGFFHMPSYAVRIAGGLQIDRSDDFAFNTGLATFRFQLRGDGDGIDDNGFGLPDPGIALPQ